MFRIQLHDYDFRLQRLINRIGHFPGQPFLHLRAGGGDFQYPPQLAHPGDAGPRHIPDPRFPEKGQQMMFADGMKHQPANLHRIRRIRLEHRVNRVGGADADPGE